MDLNMLFLLGRNAAFGHYVSDIYHNNQVNQVNEIINIKST